MQLAEHEVNRFFNIWIPLLHYVNQQSKTIPKFPQTGEQRSQANMQDVFTLRTALWENDALREKFIAENPAHLSEADLAMVQSWQHRVAGTFFIVKHTKKHTVFISTEQELKGYGVLGISNPLDEMTGPHLPIYVQAVLIPFEDRIIYDSLLIPSSLMFGAGYRRSLNDNLREIEEREGIITALPPQRLSKKDIEAKNKKLLTHFQKFLGQSGLTPKMMEEHTGVITTFAADYLLSQKPPVLLINVTIDQIKDYFMRFPDRVNQVSFKRFIQFLRDTNRIDYGNAEDMLDFFKQQRKKGKSNDQ